MAGAWPRSGELLVPVMPGENHRAKVSSENRRGLKYIRLERVSEKSVDTRRWPLTSAR